MMHGWILHDYHQMLYSNSRNNMYSASTSAGVFWLSYVCP
jgi:hypothetical protein